MLVVITILITIACILLTLVVLVQNPKGGGLGASFGGFSNQMMGVQRTTDFLEKATWTLAAVLIVFSLVTAIFVDTPTTTITNQAQPELEGSAMPTDPALNDNAPTNETNLPAPAPQEGQ